MSRRSLVLALLALAPAHLAGFCGPTSPDPCDGDRFGCSDDTSAFQLDPTCTLTGELAVELGEGEASYQALPQGAPPTIHFGGQGGQHVYLAVRVANAALDRYDKLKVTATAVTLQACPGSDGGGPAATCPQPNGRRDLVLGAAHPLRVVDGLVEEVGILLVLDWWPSDRDRRFEVRVQDPCGREGTAAHTTPAGI